MNKKLTNSLTNVVLSYQEKLKVPKEIVNVGTFFEEKEANLDAKEQSFHILFEFETLEEEDKLECEYEDFHSKGGEMINELVVIQETCVVATLVPDQPKVPSLDSKGPKFEDTAPYDI